MAFFAADIVDPICDVRSFFSTCLGHRDGYISTVMCKPIKDYLSIVREYTREIMTFGGFVLVCFVYADFRTLAREQAAAAAETETAEILRAMDARLAHLEQSTTATDHEKGH